MAAASSALAAAPYRRAAPPLCVADVAMWYGEHSGGIRTYLDEKAHFAAQYPEPDRAPRVRAEQRPLRARAHLERLPHPARRQRPLPRLRACEPDVVLMHDPFWTPHDVAELTRSIGAKLVFVHHSSAAMQSAALKGPRRLYLRGFRSWMHHAYQAADAVMSASTRRPDAGRGTDLPLRFGLHPAFRPHAGVADAITCSTPAASRGRRASIELLEAAALSAEGWTLRLVGTGPAQPAR